MPCDYSDPRGFLKENINMRLIALLFVTLTASYFPTYSQDDGTIEHVIEQLPSFPGGLDSMKAFIQKSIRHTPWTAEYHGSVIVRLVVNTDGSLADLEVVRSLCEQCDKEALEVIRLMPKWIPPRVDDRPIRTRIVIPIKFG